MNCDHVSYPGGVPCSIEGDHWHKGSRRGDFMPAYFQQSGAWPPYPSGYYTAQTSLWPWRHTTAMGLPPYPGERIIERIVAVPVYRDRPAPTPPARVYPPSQGLARPYHCTKPAGRHPGYVRVAA